MDEFKDSDWNDTFYNNVLDFSNFATIGAEESGVASGAWVGHEQEIAEWNGSSWDFYTPASGWAVIIIDEGLQYTYDGSSWSPLTSSLGHDYLSSLTGCDTASGVCYHLSSDEYNAAIREATNVLNGLMPSGKLDNWNSAYQAIITYFELDDTSNIGTDETGYIMLSGSGATTTGSGTSTNEIVINTRGDYPLDGNTLYFDIAQANTLTLSGTALIFDTTGYHMQFGGDSGGGCSETNGDDDVCIIGVTEIDDRMVVRDSLRVYAETELFTTLDVTGTGTYSGISQFNNDAIFNANGRFNDDNILRFGSGNDSGIVWDTVQTNDSMIIGVGATSKTFMITDYANIGTDLAFSNSTYPTLVLTGSNITTSPNDWVKLGFSPLGANFASGSGNFVFALGTGALVTISNLPPSSPTHTLAENSLRALGDIEVNGNLYVDTDSTFTGTGTFEGAMVYSFADVASASYTVLPTDRFIGVSYTATGTGTITIPSDFISVSGWSIDIKDSGFNASVYPVVIETEGAETIDGAANLSITTDGSAYTLISDGANLLIY